MSSDHLKNTAYDAVVEKLVLTDTVLFDSITLQSDLRSIKKADRLFDLDIPRIPDDYAAAIEDTANALQHPYVGSSNELFYYAIAKQLPRQTKDLIREDGMPDDRARVEIWREFGHIELAALLDEWHDLADEVEIQILDEGDQYPYGEIKNETEINQKTQSIVNRMEPYIRAAKYPPEEISAMVSEKFSLDLVSLDSFNRYWVSRIIGSVGFSTYRQEDRGDSWHFPSDFDCWLTKRHGAALKKHGYTFKFAFWKQETGNSRGHLWIQTDQGPLRLTDTTDAVSLKSVFPVQVMDITGEKLFELEATDVPDHLMREGPTDIGGLSKVSDLKARSGSWRKIFNWLLGKR